MKKQILNLGKALNKAEQKLVNGGKLIGDGCPENECNVPGLACGAGETCEAFNWNQSCPPGDTIRYACI